jgi:hypothetical protein
MPLARRGAGSVTDRWLRPVSLVPLPYALLMILAPRARLTQRIIAGDRLFLAYAGLYTALLARATRADPWGALGIARLDTAAITRFIGDPDHGLITVWTHMTTSDLFIARWIYRDSLARGAVARLPILAQALFGPLGLLLYLLTRRREPEAAPPPRA